MMAAIRFIESPIASASSSSSGSLPFSLYNCFLASFICNLPQTCETVMISRRAN
ncbi:RNA polymerase sigma factor sigb [Phtheirospermum japonicum]|uniref:RNA polymerase sigma factor sigb n=1 Tax=Phtheirospermum japonicum TaxID=374723 RepID=A0A830D408_9LAMI|nr:RNA polymerase sigma factor sigb [Phtheirospermum japonicum]